MLRKKFKISKEEYESRRLNCIENIDLVYAELLRTSGKPLPKHINGYLLPRSIIGKFLYTYDCIYKEEVQRYNKHSIDILFRRIDTILFDANFEALINYAFEEDYEFYFGHKLITKRRLRK